MAEKGVVKIMRPKDETLEAYKKFILELTEHITGKKQSESTMTEEEWKKSWEEFWSEE